MPSCRSYREAGTASCRTASECSPKCSHHSSLSCSASVHRLQPSPTAYIHIHVCISYSVGDPLTSTNVQTPGAPISRTTTVTSHAVTPSLYSLLQASRNMRIYKVFWGIHQNSSNALYASNVCVLYVQSENTPECTESLQSYVRLLMAEYISKS